ncbi:MAG: hypothetical protein A4E55_02283 [Pelotomaculum sp. PtaU1.Bin035]|nr:MAG: hypothetical protein A4E55_02283 [Pelotomaculum sp. PtaU1.Bin035]
MLLVNLTNETILADHIEVASSFNKRLKGLIGRSSLNHGEALILLPCNSIHTFFMNFPIDILFIDKEMVVLQAIKNIRPFRFSPVIHRSHMVIELPAGRLAATGAGVGHHLQFIFKEAAS